MIKYKCPHGRPRRRCRECGGADFCEHDSQRRYCKKCKALGIGGVGICEHDHQRHQCPVCKPESAYKPTKRNAEKRYLSFPITSGQFVSVVSQPCFYCGEDVEPRGVDRWDNNIGYEFENCRPCCWPCNIFKGIKDGQKFVERCRQIADHTRVVENADSHAEWEATQQ